MAHLVVPPRSTFRTVVAVPGQLVAAARLYRRAPARLRRPEPAARAGVTVASGWFGLLFLCLAVLSHRSGASPLSTLGYATAAVLAPLGLGLFLSRRPRVSLAVLGAMLVLGQVVTVTATLMT